MIKIIDYTGGPVASSRRNAMGIVKKLSDNVFDFSNIEVASHSFIDGLIGENYKNVKFKNCNNYVKNQIKFVITEREKKF